MTSNGVKQQKFDGKILIFGFGSIGQGVLPLLLRHLSVPPEKITIVTADKRGRSVAKEFGVRFILERGGGAVGGILHRRVAFQAGALQLRAPRKGARIAQSADTKSAADGRR